MGSETQAIISTGRGARSEATTAARRPFANVADAGRQNALLQQDLFQATLTLERRRAERSRKPFVLMLLDAHRENGLAKTILHDAVGAVTASTRETDLVGWYQTGAILGVIFTELGNDESAAITETLRNKIGTALRSNLGTERAGKIKISLHVFPENWDREHAGWVSDSKLYPELRLQMPKKKVSLRLKRLIDIVVSATILLTVSPFFALIALIIKLTSDGPVLFKQERLGDRGARFKCLKFRSMYVNCDAKVHQNYVQQFIEGKANTQSDSLEPAAPAVYKLTADPRVTRIGKFLRKTSLDELPQFWNVLRGEMSLVGPRPPVPYEFEVYDIWHRRRVLEVKPGITGLWQVSGRSSLRFDEMVRLDLQYCRSWSLWLDLKILVATPRAVFSGDGAY